MSERLALIIANTEYTDPNLAQLTAPGKDAQALAQVLGEKEICAFDNVQILLDAPESVVSEAIEEFFEGKKSDDLLLLYFSGHGVRDERGALYLAVKNTNHHRLRSTAIKSDFIREALETSRSKRVVLILDCCYSGAFSQGTKAATGASIGTATAFEAGYGRIILTVSDAMQFAWEGNQIIGDKAQNSLFTHFLVEGLLGQADLDRDGRITVDELYEYAYEKVRLATPKQTPSKFSTKQQGVVILRENIPLQTVAQGALPEYLKNSINSPSARIRAAAVSDLKELLNGNDTDLAQSARLSLEKVSKEDDSRYVSQLAEEALKPVDQTVESPSEEQGVEVFAEREAQEIVYESAREIVPGEVEKIKKRQGSRSLRVFLFHFYGDKPLVQKLYQELKAEDWIDVWLDEGERLRRQNRDDEIKMALDNSDIVMVTFSRRRPAFPKEYREKVRVFELISEKSRFILPIRLESCELPPSLQNTKSIDYFPPERHQHAYEDLQTSLLDRAKELGILMEPDEGRKLNLQITKILANSKLKDNDKARDLVKLFFSNFQPKRAEWRKRHEEELISSHRKGETELKNTYSNAEKELENEEFEKFKGRVFSRNAITRVDTREF